MYQLKRKLMLQLSAATSEPGNYSNLLIDAFTFEIPVLLSESRRQRRSIVLQLATLHCS